MRDTAPAPDFPFAGLRAVSWTAGLLLAQGQDARPVLRTVAGDRDPELDPRDVAQSLFEAVPIAAACPPSAWIELWPALERRLEAFLVALERQSRATGLARRARAVLEQRILDATPDRRPLTVGRTHALELEVTAPVRAVSLAAAVERLRCLVCVEGEPLGIVELPVCDGLVPAHVLCDAVAAEFAWVLLGRFFARTVYRAPRSTAGMPAVEELGRDFGALGQLHARVGWTVFLQELWARPEWPEERFYRADPHAPEPARPRPESRDPWLAIEVSDPLREIRGDQPLLDAEVAVGGASLGVFRLPVGAGSVSADWLLVTVTGMAGYELCRVAVREGIIGMPLDAPGTLRARLAAAAARRHRAAPGTRPPDPRLAPTWEVAVRRVLAQHRHGLVLARHDPGPVGTSASRHAALPAAAAPQLRRAAAAAGEPAVGLGRLWRWRPARVEYAPDLVWTAPAPRDGNEPLERAATDVTTARLPILVYHRVSSSGARATSRYRVTPEAFEEQIRYLAEAGYRGVTIDHWRVAQDRRRPLPGRAVILTFDDGYRDFLAHAWPTLRRYGFPAVVFLVADRIGGTNRWDAAYGETVPLLDWREIRRLRDEGVEFGSHTATHQRLTGLTPADIVREAAGSRAALQRGLGRPVTALAYPHGAEDQVVRHLIGACGYLYGFLAWQGHAGMDAPLLALPRIEVTGSDTLEDFTAKLAWGRNRG